MLKPRFPPTGGVLPHHAFGPFAFPCATGLCSTCIASPATAIRACAAAARIGCGNRAYSLGDMVMKRLKSRTKCA